MLSPTPSPVDYRDQTLNAVRMDLDGHTFARCTFNGCRFAYRGETALQLVDCRVHGPVRLLLEGSAARALQLFTFLHEHGGPQGQSAVDALCQQLRGAAASPRSGRLPR